MPGGKGTMLEYREKRRTYEPMNLRTLNLRTLRTLFHSSYRHAERSRSIFVLFLEALCEINGMK